MRTPRLLVGLALALFATPAHAHDCQTARATEVPGSPGLVRIETASRTRIVHAPPAAPARAMAVAATIRALLNKFDADNSTATVVDTVRVNVGATVRFQWVTGVHTLTNGTGSDDPDAGTKFDYSLDAAHPVFDTTFTQPTVLNFFCTIHEVSSMRGVIIVSAQAGVPPGGNGTIARFTRPPTPNPSRGEMRFAIGLPREAMVEIAVLDMSGRRVATLANERVAAGERTFRWNGIAAGGAAARPGRYVVRMRADGVVTTRAFSLLR
jgi:plastocyanin